MLSGAKIKTPFKSLLKILEIKGVCLYVVVANVEVAITVEYTTDQK